MSKLILQAQTISGNLIEGGRWEVEFPAGLQEGQHFSLNLPVTDPHLIRYLSKVSSIDCVLDKDGNKFSVSLSCPIRRVRHMVSTTTGEVESMGILVPINRTIESVLLFVIAPNKCDPRFIRLVRGDQGAPPGPPPLPPVQS